MACNQLGYPNTTTLGKSAGYKHRIAMAIVTSLVILNGNPWISMYYSSYKPSQLVEE